MRSQWYEPNQQLEIYNFRVVPGLSISEEVDLFNDLYVLFFLAFCLNGCIMVWMHHDDGGIMTMDASWWCIHHDDASIITIHALSWFIHHHDASITMMHQYKHHDDGSSWESARNRSDIGLQSSRLVQTNPLAWTFNFEWFLTWKKGKPGKQIFLMNPPWSTASRRRCFPI